MAVYSVKKKLDSDRGQSDGAKQGYTATWLVETDRGDTLDAVFNAPGMPRWGSAYGTSAAFFESASLKGCSTITQPSGIEHKTWEIDVQYSTAVLPDAKKPSGNQQSPNQNSPIEDPLDREPVRRWRTISKEFIQDHDLEGRPLCNVNMEKFASIPSHIETVPVLTIVRNEILFGIGTMENYGNAVNRDVFFGRPAGQVLCASIAGDERVENGIRFWEVNYEFHFRKRGWKIRLLNDGTFAWNNNSAREIRFADATGQQWCSIPEAGRTYPIDKTGHRTGGRILLTQLGTDATSEGGEPYYLQFTMHREAQFGNLHLER